MMILQKVLLSSAFFNQNKTIIYQNKDVKKRLLKLMMSEERKVFQYFQFKSLVAPDFWYKLAEVKLDVEKLNESERDIKGTFSNFNAKSCVIEIDCTAFNK
jgi:Ubiquitin-like modifier-activating enzyme ATG7 N-terminus